MHASFQVTVPGAAPCMHLHELWCGVVWWHRGVEIEMETAGLCLTLIDFTLSRLQTGTGAIAFCDLSADPELFTGPKGDCQARASCMVLTSLSRPSAISPPLDRRHSTSIPVKPSCTANPGELSYLTPLFVTPRRREYIAI